MTQLPAPDTPYDPNSLLSYTQHQNELMARMAKQAETHGFCIVHHAANPHTTNDRLFNFFAGGFGIMFDAWCRIHGRKYIRINVWSHENLGPPAIRSWAFEIPRTRRLRGIVAALDLFCDNYKGVSNYELRTLTKNASRPLSLHHSDRFEYQGKDATSLKLVLEVLRVPDHRQILTDTYTPKDPLKRY
jgi:hypothetical protein